MQDLLCNLDTFFGIACYSDEAYATAMRMGFAATLAFALALFALYENHVLTKHIERQNRRIEELKKEATDARLDLSEEQWAHDDTRQLLRYANSFVARNSRNVTPTKEKRHA